MNNRRGPISADQNLNANDQISAPFNVAGFDFASLLLDVTGAAAGRTIQVALYYPGLATPCIINPVPTAVSQTVGTRVVLKVDTCGAESLIVATGPANWSAGNELNVRCAPYSAGATN